MKQIILILIDNLTVGGGQNVVYEFAKNIDCTKYSVTVLCYGPKQNTIVESALECMCNVEYMNISGRITLIHVWKVLRKISSLTSSTPIGSNPKTSG